MARATEGTRTVAERSAARTLRPRALDWTMSRITSSSFEAFEELRPVWAESLFDLHFLLHSGAPTLQRLVRPDGDRSVSDAETVENSYVDELAKAYVRQWGFDSERNTRLVQEVLPACRDFLHIFKAQLTKVSEAETPAGSSGRPSLLDH